MAKTGATWTADATYTVTSIGSIGDQDGWTTVAAVPLTVFLSGTSEYVFFVSGAVGDVDTTISLPLRTRVEVGLFEGAAATAPFKTFRTLAQDPGINAQYGGVALRGMPFQMLAAYSSAPWTATNQLLIKARFFRNGDVAMYGGSFKVSDLSVLVFDLDAIGGSNYLVHEFLPTGGSGLNNLLSEGWKQYWRTNVFGATGQRWAYFSALDYEPKSLTNAPWYRVEVAPNNDWVTLNPAMGTTRLGVQCRGSISGVGMKAMQCGAAWLDVATNNTTIALRGIDRHNVTNDRTSLNSWTFFAWKFEAQAYDTKNYSASSSLAVADLTESTYLACEMAAASTNNINILGNSINGWSISGLRSTRTWSKMNDGVPTIPKTNRMPACVVNYEEGLYHTACGQRANAGASVQHRFIWNRNPNEAAEGALPMEDVFVMAWDWETGPDTASYAAEVSGSPVSVTTEYEALGLGSLNTLPFEPDSAAPVQVDYQRNELRTKRGDLLTWPRFLAPRQTWQLEWTLSRADSKTLLTWFAAQSNTAFKWTSRITRAAIPLAIVEDPSADDSGLVIRVSIRAVELQFVGP